MIVINTVNKAIHYLSEGCLLARVPLHFPGMTNACHSAGNTMGLTREDWWYTFIRPESGAVCGMLDKKLFVELYQRYYIDEVKGIDNWGKYYALNDACPIQEFTRYKRQIDCWTDYISRPLNYMQQKK